VSEGGRPVADGALVLEAGAAPSLLPPLPPATPSLPDPYASGAMFHGPAYHRVVSGRRGATGVDLVIRLDAAADGRERISHIVLDAGLHGVPHDDMTLWFPEVAPGQVAYPAHVERFRVYGPMPAEGMIEVRVRPAGVRGSARFPRVRAQFLHDGRVWAELVLVEACFPATRLGALSGEARRAFLRDGVYVEGARLSETADDASVLSAAALASADWLPGTVRAIYGLEEGDAPLETVVAREHAAARLGVHPRRVAVGADGRVRAAALPLLDYGVTVESDARQATARDAWPPRLDADAIGRWWEARGWQSRVPALQPLFLAACRRFVRAIRLVDPEAISALHGQPLLLLANHQVAVESVLAGTALPPVIGRPLLTLAKREHQDTWVGRLAMGLNDDRHGPAIVYVDRDRQQDMLERLAEMAHQARSGARSLMVHVEGTRATRGRQPVSTVSAVWADLAVQAGLTIVPLRYCGGLPAQGTKARLEFPYGFGGQALALGRPLPGAELAALPLNARRDRILAGLAELEAFDFDPQPDPPLATRVHAAEQRWGLDEVRAVFLLLQADASGWALDDEGLPADAVARHAADDPFWAWFEQHGRAPAGR
jgi:1-acyl-sn-glycerol-3-phosphate acyltransferase